MEGVRKVTSDGVLLAIIVEKRAKADVTAFLTETNSQFQLGFVVRHAGEEISRHSHRDVSRNLSGTSEALLVRKGRAEVSIYGRDNRLVDSQLLGAGDVILFLAGGHALRALDDLEILEVKQGPYLSSQDKDRF